MIPLSLSSGRNLLSSNFQVSRYALQAIGNQIRHRGDAVTQRRHALDITADNSSRLLQKLNVQVKPHFHTNQSLERNYFMVCNHMSYLDILILSSVRPAVFVTSVEMENTFFLGDMAKWGGSFFVDRVNRRKIKAEVEALAQLLKQGFNVFIFPEGTSTDGSQILPFKKSLFRVPFQTQFPILPICLKYTSIDGVRFSSENCDRVCWHGDMTFAPHFLQLMGVQEVQVEVHYLEPLYPQDFDSHGDLAKVAEEQIRRTYNRATPN
jgi:1-acyl-sn-glycerol-3-phosphate acyltransferase